MDALNDPGLLLEEALRRWLGEGAALAQRLPKVLSHYRRAAVAAQQRADAYKAEAAGLRQELDRLGKDGIERKCAGG